MSKIFIDSSILVPLFWKEHPNHNKVAKHLSIIKNNECYMSNGILSEVMTVLGMKTKNIDLVKIVYDYLQDNFKILNEYEINDFNFKVFSVFQKYNKNAFKVSFIDCSSVVIVDEYGLDNVMSLDKNFKRFEEIDLVKLED